MASLSVVPESAVTAFLLGLEHRNVGAAFPTQTKCLWTCRADVSLVSTLGPATEGGEGAVRRPGEADGWSRARSEVFSGRAVAKRHL